MDSGTPSKPEAEVATDRPVTPEPETAPKPVDTGAQEQAGQDRAGGGGYT